jgi:acyl transferase domain-containing protein
VESIRFFSAEEALAAGANPRRVNNPRHVRAAPILDGIEDFDAEQFGLTRREAEILHPAHRVFLECAVAALDHAGYDPARYPGAIGVYGGVGEGEYAWSHLLENRALMSAVGSMAVALANHRDYATTFTSYKLNLRGPSLSVATACSTGLVAVHLACALTRSDAQGVGDNLVVAFSAVILALVSASITFFVLTIRRRWLLQELRDIERAREVA